MRIAEEKALGGGRAAEEDLFRRPALGPPGEPGARLRVRGDRGRSGVAGVLPRLQRCRGDPGGAGTRPLEDEG